MSKSTITYWNPIDKSNDDKWEIMEDTDGLVEELTLAIDKESGDHARS